MATYVLGGATLFAIGFITYEIYESIKKVTANVANTTKPITDAYANAQQSYSQYAPYAPTAADLTLGLNPITMPFAVAYDIYEAL